LFNYLALKLVNFRLISNSFVVMHNMQFYRSVNVSQAIVLVTMFSTDM